MTRAEQIRIATLALDDVFPLGRAGNARAAEWVIELLAESPIQRIARLFGAPPWKVIAAGKDCAAMELHADRLRTRNPTWRVRVREGLVESDGSTRWVAVEVRVADETEGHPR